MRSASNVPRTAGTASSRTSRVIAIEKTPSLNASTRELSLSRRGGLSLISMPRTRRSAEADEQAADVGHRLIDDAGHGRGVGVVPQVKPDRDVGGGGRAPGDLDRPRIVVLGPPPRDSPRRPVGNEA